MNVPAKQPFFLWRLARGVWNTLNFGRRLVLNLLFLLLLGAFVAAIVSGPPTVTLHCCCGCAMWSISKNTLLPRAN